MTTKEAFIRLLDSPELIEKLNLNANTLRTIRKRVKDKKLISVDKMEELLLKAGATKKPEAWKLSK
jgi:hypothetical protein